MFSAFRHPYAEAVWLSNPVAVACASHHAPLDVCIEGRYPPRQIRCSRSDNDDNEQFVLKIYRTVSNVSRSPPQGNPEIQERVAGFAELACHDGVLYIAIMGNDLQPMSRGATRTELDIRLIVRSTKDINDRVEQGDPFLSEVVLTGRVMYEDDH